MAGTDEDALAVRMMQFNIRTGFADIGTPHAWQTVFGALGLSRSRESRRFAAAAAILQYEPDVVATQEGLRWQMEHLQHDTGNRYVSIGRPRGTHFFDNETSAILYDAKKWRHAEHGDFMNSPNPFTWGSKYDGGSWPMITSWAVLESISAVGARILVVNVHLDPCSADVRILSARQILTEATRLREEHSCKQAFVIGDFNADCDEESYTLFIDAGWKDTYKHMHGAYEAGSFTFHGFEGATHKHQESDHVKCIDFILCWPQDMQIVSASVDKRRYGAAGPETGSIFPSDHYPVIVDVKIPQQY